MQSALQPTPPVVLQLAASVLRHFLTLGAGVLAADGAIAKDQQSQLTAIGVAVGLWVIAMAWSWAQKRGLSV